MSLRVPLRCTSVFVSFLAKPVFGSLRFSEVLDVLRPSQEGISEAPHTRTLGLKSGGLGASCVKTQNSETSGFSGHGRVLWEPQRHQEGLSVFVLSINPNLDSFVSRGGATKIDLRKTRRDTTSLCLRQ